MKVHKKHWAERGADAIVGLLIGGGSALVGVCLHVLWGGEYLLTVLGTTAVATGLAWQAQGWAGRWYWWLFAPIKVRLRRR